MADKKSLGLTSDSMETIVSVLKKEALEDSDSLDENTFYEALKIVAKKAGIAVKPFTIGTAKKLNYVAFLEEISVRSDFSYREVELRGEWWREDNGPLLTWKDSKPCALIPHKTGYLIIDPVTKIKTVVTSEVAKSLIAPCYYLYRHLPTSRLRLRDILRFSLTPLKPELKRVIILQLITSILSLLIPGATALLFTIAIPFADLSIIAQTAFILIANAFVVAGFMIGQILALLRIKLKANASLQPALWDRLFSFRMSFFKDFLAGDLVNRTKGIDYIQQEFSIALILSIVSGVVALVSIIVLFFIDAMLSVIILALIIIMMIVSLALISREITYLRRNFNLLGKIFGLLLQMFNSIGKLRVSHAENRILKIWANLFSDKTRMFYKAGNIVVINSVVSTLFSTLITIVFLAMILMNDPPISFGKFIFYNSVFTQLFISLTSILASVSQLVRSIPLYERLAPLLQTTTEMHDHEKLAPTLYGQMELKDIIFRYPTSEFLICDNLSLKVEKGQYIGIIGPSGVGKSTLIRLLLDFETPQSGKIFYDGHDLTTLDLDLFRRQLGVVLQNSMAMRGTILDNIIGINTSLTIEDAWQAAHLVKFDNDIKEMPMGMQTVITEGGYSLSMGQRQRLLLARALVKKPNILFLDEATSGLDNQTRDYIRMSIESLNITRIVITQHPQFLINADTILILEEGKISAKGPYQEIITTDAFKRLQQ